jgi:rhodanese-related sulfurtransferase
MVAAAALKTQGFTNVKNVWGGWSQIKDEPKAQIAQEAVNS